MQHPDQKKGHLIWLELKGINRCCLNADLSTQAERIIEVSNSKGAQESVSGVVSQDDIVLQPFYESTNEGGAHRATRPVIVSGPASRIFFCSMLLGYARVERDVINCIEGEKGKRSGGLEERRRCGRGKNFTGASVQSGWAKAREGGGTGVDRLLE